MRVVCDQCAASYKVPNERLTKPINKATCKQCGSRLLIPKPQPGSDPEERVVVPAVPASAAMGSRGHFRPGVADDDDKTVPVVDRTGPKLSGPNDDVALLTGSPLAAADRERLAAASQRGATPIAAPQPPPPRPVASGSNGLGMAMASVVAVLVGVFLLAIGITPELRFAGTFLAVSGAITSMLVLTFSNFGRQAGHPILALSLGMLLGLMMSASISVLREGPPAWAGTNQRSMPARPVQPVPVAPVPVPAEGQPATPAGEVPAAPVPPEATPVPAPPATPAPERHEPAAVAPTPAPTPRAAPVRVEPTPRPVRAQPTPRPTPRPTPIPRTIEPDPEPEPTPLPPPDPPRVQPTPEPMPDPIADGLPMNVKPEVIQMIVTSNVGVKRCFFEALKSREIEKPITVNTTFNLAASGAASNLRVNNSELRSSKLERCLDGAFRTMSFPPSQKGGPVNFPFKL